MCIHHLTLGILLLISGTLADQLYSLHSRAKMAGASRSKLKEMDDGSGLISGVMHRNMAFTFFLQRKAKISFCKSDKLAGSVTDVEVISICTDPDCRRALCDSEIPRPHISKYVYEAVSMHIAMFLILF
jgi:hypothetical protein